MMLHSLTDITITQLVTDEIKYNQVSKVTLNQKDLELMYKMRPLELEMLIGNLYSATCIVES